VAGFVTGLEPRANPTIFLYRGSMADLEVLRCTKCDAPLVLGDADQISCPSCGAANPVPEPYRALHRARLADHALRAESERLLRTLDTPPSMVTKVLARVFDLPMLAFMLAFGVPLTVFAFLEALRLTDKLAPHVGYASGDDAPFAITVAFAAAIILIFAFVPHALGIYANRRATQRAQLLAALRARPPTVEGGPALCRLCGAPLAVLPDELVASCSYCQAENAVKLATPIVAGSQAQVKALRRTIRDVAAGDRAERHATRLLLVRELVRYVIWIGVFAVLFVLAGREDEDHHPTTAGIIGIVGFALLLIAAPIVAMSGHKTSDAKQRVAGNDAPEWISYVGWIGVLVVLEILRFVVL